MFTKALSYLSNFFIFIFVFSFFNDNFIVDNSGATVIKILFLIFFLFYTFNILKNFKTMYFLEDKLFFIFYITNLITFFLQIILSYFLNITFPALLLISSFFIVLFFSRYPITKLLYFIWFSMVFSVIICYFNQPINAWTFRTSGGTEDPNEFATQLLIFISISVYLFLKNKNLVFISLSFILFSYGFLKAGSMSAFLVFSLIIFLSTLRLIIRSPSYFINYKSLLLIMTLFILGTQISLTRPEAINNILERTKHTRTADFRIHSWQAGINMIEKNLLIGVGINQFASNTPKYEEYTLAGSVPEAHNVYIKLFAESGIFAFMSFLLFIIYILFHRIKYYFYHDEWFLIVMLLSTLLMGLTLSLTYDKYFWLAIAITMNLHYTTRTSKA